MARAEGAYPGTNRNAPGFAVDPPAGGIGHERRTTRSARIPSAFGAAHRGPAATDPVALA